MPLEDKDIFTAVFEKYRDQSIEFVMSQYEKAKLLNRDIERRINSLDAGGAQPAAAPLPPVSPARPVPAMPATVAPQPSAPAAETAAPRPARKRPGKKDLIMDPQQAITRDSIACCLCGQQFNTLTVRHLKNHHNISVGEYKELCDYAPSQKLMSFDLAETIARNVQKAQAARQAKRQAARQIGDTPVQDA